MSPGRKIKNLRLDRGLQQTELADACGLTVSAISKIESGINYPRAGSILPIARVLGVTIEYLVDETQPYPYVPPPKKPEIKNPQKKVQREITLEEAAFLEDMRKRSKKKWRIAQEIPYLSQEKLVAIHMILHGKIRLSAEAVEEYWGGG